MKKNKCQGKCHLKKILKENNPNKKEKPIPEEKNQSPSLFFVKETDQISLKQPEHISLINIFYLTILLNGHVISVFHPPCIA